MNRKEYYLNDVHDEVPKEHATVKVIEIYREEKLIGRFWVSLGSNKEKSKDETKCSKCS